MEKKLQLKSNKLIDESDLIISETMIQRLKSEDLAIDVCNDPSRDIKIYSKKRIPISDIIPILDDFGLKTNSEITYEAGIEEMTFYITKLDLQVPDTKLLMAHKEHIKELLLRVMGGEIESGRLLGLVYYENFSAKEILLSRAFGNYAEQIILDFNKGSLEDCIVRYPHIFAHFLKYFLAKFDPDVVDREKILQFLDTTLMESFKEIESITDDRMMKLVYEMIQAVVRTNYFMECETIALKFDVSRLSDILKGVQPHFETFVYAHDFKGTHLRVSKVCRGGIRWSNRDDFRTEVRSLMATQEAKNAVIVPKGAKGGFVITRKGEVSKEAFNDYYTRFINALLDVVDNKIDGKIQRDPASVIYDDEDPYFVVAADKGTSSMSDRANEIAIGRGFWLLDAFASGSSTGYHHKKLGVTAKGAVKSSERFFIEEGIDIRKESITIVGVGSMSGDVFGNGLLESEKFLLVGAISSDEIFIDPNPDPLISYEERKRLFSMERGKWSSYDPSKISKGGGVFKRNSKSIALTSEMQSMLNTKATSLNGEELGRLLLQVQVDLLYFGGIGTYVKSSSESNITLGDKENEYLRIDATEVKARRISEGANLALTMPARIEYALGGGKVNLDSIDNSAGVDTSDHEVNLKILLNILVNKSEITEDEKLELLERMSETVVSQVLHTNYLQSLSISLDYERSQKDIALFKHTITVLEGNLSVFKREYFNIPKEREFDEVIDTDGALVRPVLATMMLYAKILMQEILSSCTMYEDEPFFETYLFAYFPKMLATSYEAAIRNHPLKKEIISMIVANEIINQAGITFIADLDHLGKEGFLQKIKAYLVTNQLFDADEVREVIYAHDYRIRTSEQYHLLLQIEDEIAYNVSWMMKVLKREEIRFESILEYKNALKEVVSSLGGQQKLAIFEDETVNVYFSNLNYFKFASAVFKIKQSTKADFKSASEIFYKLVIRLQIQEVMASLKSVSAKNKIQEDLRVQLQQLIELALIRLATALLGYKREGENNDDVIDAYLAQNNFDMHTYKLKLDYIKNTDHLSISDLSVTVNHLLLLFYK
jgi:glutamate dehydrogenase